MSGGGGGGGGGGLSKLGVVLTVIFAITLLALFVQFFYFLWRRRVLFRRRMSGGSVGVGGGADRLNLYESSSDSTFSSKELLYFFCIRRQSRMESNSVTATTRAIDDLSLSNRQLDVESIDVDVFKVQGMFGPPRFLFTIKEEEKEDLESPADRSLHSGDKFSRKIGDVCRNSAGSLEECFKAADEAAVLVVSADETTPFSTPCESPSYFTPAGSPVHEAVVGGVAGEESKSRELIEDEGGRRTTSFRGKCTEVN